MYVKDSFVIPRQLPCTRHLQVATCMCMSNSCGNTALKI